MPSLKRVYTESALANLALEIRKGAGKTQKEVAHELGVSQASVSNAELCPERSLFELRKRIIEKYSNYKLVGPEFRLIPR